MPLPPGLLRARGSENQNLLVRQFAPMPLTPGARLGPYEVLSSLGAGGMGEVYRARDTKLGRDVAIKVLSASFAADADRLRRFEQEARTAGALNHPNLVTVFELGVLHDAPYIVMELVEGETLRQRLAAAIPVRKAIDFAIQIASGLAAAHDRGVVHRDLKPENIIVTPDGRLKILDFGLAKTMAAGGRGLSPGTGSAAGETMMSPTETQAGMVLGTVGYMAPEQVRGDAAVDHRADLFALGAILHEMLSGRRAFQGASAVETMNAILREDPPDLGRESTEVSPSLARVVQRCLEKNPAERFQSARDLGFHLSALAGDSGLRSGAAPAVGAPRKSRRTSMLSAVAITGVAAGLALGWIFLRQPPVEPVRFETFTYSGSDGGPAVSPDGKTIAFSSSRNGQWQIWLKQIAGGGEIARTQGPDDTSPRFSPDGMSLLFLRNEGGQVHLYRTTVLSGEERRVLSDVVAADWSPDGTTIGFAAGSAQGEPVVGIVQADGAGRRSLHSAPGWSPRSVAWSPDGRSLLAVFQPGVGTTGNQMTLVPVDGGQPRVLQNAAAAGSVSAPAWTASGEIVYATSSTGSAVGLADRSLRVVAHDTTTDQVRTLFWTVGAPAVMDVVAAGTLAFDARAFNQNLRSVPLRALPNTDSTWLTRGSSIDRQPAFSPDNDSVIFASNRSRNLDLWVLSRRDGSLKRLTDDASADWDPAFTPDGKNILWSSNRSGNFEIWMAAADGSGARQVSHDGVDAENPTMTPDRQWVLHWSSNPEKRGIWKVRPDGTDATLLIKGLYNSPEISPDGVYVATPEAPVGQRRRILASTTARRCRSALSSNATDRSIRTTGECAGCPAEKPSRSSGPGPTASPVSGCRTSSSARIRVRRVANSRASQRTSARNPLASPRTDR
jgi:Tol biopolymer transport system component